MLYVGTTGATAEEMEKVLHVTLNRESLIRVFRQLASILNVDGGFDLVVANAIAMPNPSIVRPLFIEKIRTFFGGELLSIPEVNGWVERKTRGNIKNILAGGGDALTVIVNAIYFKGKWELPFKKVLTQPAPFYPLGSNPYNADIMHGTENFGYLETSEIQFLEMEYKPAMKFSRQQRVSMVIMLPRAKDGILSLEKRMTLDFLTETVKNLQNQVVEVYLPKFKMQTQYNLAGALQSMGMLRAFTNDSEFSDISENPMGVKIGAVMHKATVDVDEEGTVATAATVISMVPTCAFIPENPPPPIFLADHPFVFLIRDTGTSAILFIGKLARPEPSKGAVGDQNAVSPRLNVKPKLPSFINSHRLGK